MIYVLDFIGLFRGSTIAKFIDFGLNHFYLNRVNQQAPQEYGEIRKLRHKRSCKKDTIPVDYNNERVSFFA